MPRPTGDTQVEEDDNSIALSNEEKAAAQGTAYTGEGQEENNL